MEGIKKVKAQYIKTMKNKPAENFLSDFGFIRNGDIWIFETTKPIKKPEHLVIS
jgi:predicted enzyme involved in methoxymalonyl-ACP biosynthesis